MAYSFQTAFFMVYLFCCIGLHDCKSSNMGEVESKWNGCLRSKYELKCNGLQREIPEGVTSVHLNDVVVQGSVLKRGTFSSKNWEYVTKLTITADNVSTPKNDAVKIFDSMCFYGLKNLMILRISISTGIKFRSETFKGISKLESLDLSECRRLYIDNLISALNNIEAVPNLRSLNLSYFNNYRSGIRLTDSFFRLIHMKRIKELDLSSVQVLFINLTSFGENCGTLEYLNISFLMLNDYVFDHRPKFCKNLKKLDASYITLPTTMIPDRSTETVVYENISAPIFLNHLFFRNVEYINMAGVSGKQTKYVLKNITVYLYGMSMLNIKTLVLRDNNFERLDVRFNSKGSKLESIDMSRSEIRFLNPMALSSFSLLKTIDISNNRLNDMVVENPRLFERLFQNLTQLKNIKLSGNQLKDIPYKMFISNPNLETIDLSNNLLTQLSFAVESIQKLQRLHLEQNQIKIFDSASLIRLNTIEQSYYSIKSNVSDKKVLFKFTNNPIRCSSCDSLASITWIFHSRSAIESYSSMTCRDNDMKQFDIDQSAINSVQTMCNRPKEILISCIAIACVLIVAVLFFFVIRAQRRRKVHELEMADRVALIREGAERHQFVVFLSYSSNDEEFVEQYVYNSLNEHLRHMIGDDRDLVCEGDRDFQLGRPINDQISVLLKRSSVVLVVLTDSYSQSIHCRNEFDQAYMLEKPIVLMIKDEVDTRLMTPLIMDLYEKRTRVLWMWEDGEYKLKTTWENLCESIVELVNYN